MTDLRPELQAAIVESDIGLIFIHHPLFVGIYTGTNLETEHANKVFDLKSEVMATEADYLKRLRLIEKPYKLDFIHSEWNGFDDMDGDLVAMLTEAWPLVEFPCSDGRLEEHVELFRAAGYVTDGPPRFEKPTYIFRGGDAEGMSWTLSWVTAVFFANRFNEDLPLHVALAPEAAVLARFESRGEDEVVVDPFLLEEIQELDKDQVPDALYRRL